MLRSSWLSGLASSLSGLALCALASAALQGCVDVQLGGAIDDTTTGTPTVTEWRGYVEGFSFDSGSSDVLVRLSAYPSGTVTGIVRFGDAPDLPAATDPSVTYPPGFKGLIPVNDTLPPPREGFDFTIEGLTVTSDRILGEYSSNEVWDTWCSLQTSYLVPGKMPVDHSCRPMSGYVIGETECTTTEGDTIDCGIAWLCQGDTCDCDAAACHGASPSTPLLTLDFHVDGDSAQGTIQGLGGATKKPVAWLTRVAP